VKRPVWRRLRVGGGFAVLVGLLGAALGGGAEASGEARVNPLSRLAVVDGAAWTAPVDEVLDAGGYAYLRVRGQWVATLNDGFRVGQSVEVRPMGMIRGWRSQRLGRELGDVVFAAVDAVDQAPS
jgi:hypothetical protein